MPILKEHRQQLPTDRPWTREEPPPAPHLTSGRNCSDCGVPTVDANDGMLVCSKCFALLRHKDYTLEIKRRQELTNQKMRETRERNRQRELERKARVNEERKQMRDQLSADAKRKQEALEQPRPEELRKLQLNEERKRLRELVAAQHQRMREEEGQ